MKSALLLAIVESGWRLGFPVAVVVEQRIGGSLFMMQAFVGYITRANHTRLVLSSKDHMQ